MELLLPGLGLLVWTLLAFLIVFFLLKSFAWKPILSSLKERETGIADAIASADKVKAEYDRIVAEAQSAIMQQKNAALTDVKNQVGALVIEVAEKVLSRELSNKGDQENYIKQLAEGVKLN